MPPRRLLHPGDGDFAASGDALLARVLSLARPTPGERVLDVGCGFGRLARPLTRHLDHARGGAYVGFDVDPVAVGWCQARYPPHFSFVHADVYNRRLHPSGTGKASDYRFPCEDGGCDVAVLASTLAHLLEHEAARYLTELARTLAPRGRAVVELFVLDRASREAIVGERAARRFLAPDAHVAVLRDELPEEAVAYDADWLRARLDDHGLCVRGELRPGAWRGELPADAFHDVLVIAPCS